MTSPHITIAAALSVRLEWLDGVVVLSPPLGDGWLCERCWLQRRVATLDPATLCVGARDAEQLIAAFERRVAAAGRPSADPRVHELLRERVRELERGPVFPLRLDRIGVDGVLRREAVLAMPDCARCWADQASAAEPRLDHVLGRAAGIVAQLQEVAARPGEPDVPHVIVARLANSWLQPRRSFWAGASGKGGTLPTAIGSALGESIERYCASARPESMVRARAAELDGADGSADLERERDWVLARSIRDPEHTRWLPASAVCLSASGDAGLTSSGLACARSLSDAIDGGLAELIERHAFFMVWYGAAPAEREHASELLAADLRARFRDAGLVLVAALLGSMAGVHVAAASCWPTHPSEARPGFALGLGTGRTREAAVAAAGLELGQVYRGLSWALQHDELRRRAAVLAADPSAVAEPYDHALLYAARSPRAVPRPFGLAPPRSGARFEAPGHERDAVFVELSTRDVVAATGCRVVRVIAPHCMPLHVGVHHIPRGLRLSHDSSVVELLHPLS